MKKLSYTVPAVLTALVATPAFAQAVSVDNQLAAADLTTGIGSAQGLIIAAVIVLVGFAMLRRAFGK